jgi:hypothetical protein
MECLDLGVLASLGRYKRTHHEIATLFAVKDIQAVGGTVIDALGGGCLKEMMCFEFSGETAHHPCGNQHSHIVSISFAIHKHLQGVLALQ